jgi:hypothetical protein
MDYNLLVAAKTEYTEQLEDILIPHIHEGIKKIWSFSKKEKEPLKFFQKELCKVHLWNQEYINNIYLKLVSENNISKEYIDKIIEAVFLSNIKILSVIKLNDKKKTINVSVPDTKHFIHKSYIETARKFYVDPYMIDDRAFLTKKEIQINVNRSLTAIKESIEKTIRNMMPMEDILEKYLQVDLEEENYKPQPAQEPQPSFYSEPEQVHEVHEVHQEEDDYLEQEDDVFKQPQEPQPQDQQEPQELDEEFNKRIDTPPEIQQPVQQEEFSEEKKTIPIQKEDTGSFFD